MSKVAGRWTEIYFAGYDLTGNANQVNVGVEYAEDDTTGFGEGAVNSIADVPNGLAEITTFLDPDTDKSHDALKGLGGYTDQAFMALFGHNAAPAIGDGAFAMLCKQFKYSPRVALRSAVIANATFLPGGYLPDINAVVLADTTITNTTAFASVNNGAASSNGLAAYLEILTPVATDSYVIKVQHSTNDSTWIDLITFAADGQSRTSERLEVAGTVNAYLRILATRTGAAAQSLKLAVVAARH